MIGSLLSLLLSAALAATLAAGSTFVVVPAQSSIRYGVTHKLHAVEATSSEVEGKAVVREDGTVVAQVRVPVATFRSGDANRDTHMLEAVEAGTFPFATVKLALRLPPGPALPEGAVPADAEVDFHGVKRRGTIPVSVSRQADGTLRARATFDVSLDAHGVARPSLLFVKVDDACRMTVELLLREESR